MWQIQTLNKIDPVINQIMKEGNYLIANDTAEPDAIIVRSANLHEMEFSSNLLAIARAGAGTNNIPIDRCSENGIVVFNTPGANANAVAELVIAAIIMASRNIAASTFWVNGQPKDDTLAATIEKGKNQFVGGEIAGKTIGLIGLGAIGILVANKAAALGMEVYGYDPFLTEITKKHLSQSIHIVSDLDELFQKCKFISLHLPSKAETKGLFNASVFEKLAGNNILLNFARGDLVDSKDLLQAIEDGKILHYTTDFPSADMLGNPNITAIPHLGASTPESETKCAYMAATQTAEYLENGNIINSVNLPNCSLPGKKENRISIIYKTDKANEADIFAKLGTPSNKASATRKDLGYILADFNNPIDPEALTGFNGILKVRAV